MLFLLLSISLLHASESRIIHAVDLLEQKKLDAAVSELKNVEINSKNYPIAFLELQKINYKNKSWDQFFGYASFYRTKLISRFFSPKLLILETMALIKHCQYDAAGKVLALTKEKTDTKAFPNESQKIKDIENLLFLQQNVNKQVSTTAKNNTPRIFTKELQWKISIEAQDKVIKELIKSPESLKVYVKNTCTKSEGDK